MCTDLSRIRKTKLRTNLDIQKIFLFLVSHGPSKQRDFPAIDFPITLLKKTIIKMEDFRIILKVRDKDGLYIYSVAHDLLNEDVTKPVTDPVLKRRVPQYENWG